MEDSFYCVFSIKIAKITGHPTEDVIIRNRDQEDTIKQLRTTLNYARVSIAYETPSQIAVQCTLVQVPEIKKILQAVQDTVRIYLGIGEELEEAQNAAEYAQHESKSIQMYDAEVKQYMDDKRGGLIKAEGEYTKIDARDKESIKEYLTVIQQSAQTFEQLKQTNPDAYASVVGIVENITNLLIEDKQRQDEELKAILEQAIKIMNINEVKVIDREKFDIHKVIHDHVQDHNSAQEQVEAAKQQEENEQRLIAIIAKLKELVLMPPAAKA